MDLRLIIAYGLIALMTLFAVLASLHIARKRQEERDLRHGKPPKRRR